MPELSDESSSQLAETRERLERNNALLLGATKRLEETSKKQEETSKKLKALNDKVADLSSRVPKATPFYGFAVVLGLLGYVAIIFRLVDQEVLDSKRIVIHGVAALVIGVLIFVWAHGLVKAVLKALVELVAALVGLFNALAVLWAWRSPPFARSLTEMMGLSLSEEKSIETFVFAVIFIFTLNMAVFFVLYPLSQSAGTSLDDLE